MLTTRDAAGVETHYEYDDLGRTVKTIGNYVDGVFSQMAPDEDLVSQTVYNKGGQVVQTIDARSTKTALVYDYAGRQRQITTAAETSLAVSSYTCYDKAGRVLRTIHNYIPLLADASLPPEAKDEQGYVLPDAWDSSVDIWWFAPTQHGNYHDQNIITDFVYDAASRRTKVIDPLGNIVQTAYFEDGQIDRVTDPEGVQTAYRYDGLRRRNLVVQGYIANTEDPANWVWDGTDSRYEQSDGTAIVHGSDNDQNVIVQVVHDLIGRMTSLRDPRGNVTAYEYDLLGRRTKLTNPLNNEWRTAYTDLTDGGTRTVMTYPGITGSSNYDVTREFDRMGRLNTLDYGAASVTPTVVFAYDEAGNRAKMVEYNGAADNLQNRIRETTFGYDDVRRLNSVQFAQNTSGDGTTLEQVETVNYQYDANGHRTQMTLPGNLSVDYVYDEQGQLVSLTDWGGQETRFAYDLAGRHIATFRPNNMRSRYMYDTAGRLTSLRHDAGRKTLGYFAYEMDKRGNRTQALEVLPNPATTNDTLIDYDDTSIVADGTWTLDNGFRTTESFSSKLFLMCFGNNVKLTIGTGVNHTQFDVYVGGSFWQTIDGYNPTDSTRQLDITLTGDGPHLLEIRNRPQHSLAARKDAAYDPSKYIVRFKQVVLEDIAFDLHTIQYTYDDLSRLTEARYNPGIQVDLDPADLLQHYNYGYDLAGNLVNMDGTTRTYNAANQMTNDGTNTLTYDLNGNLTNDGVNAYTWDRANRMLTAPGSTSYKYNGLDNRIQQTVSSTVTNYLLDLQPGLAKVLRQDDGTNTDHFIHSPRGIHAQYDGTDWQYLTQDGLGSVRNLVSDSLGVDAVQSYNPMGVPNSDYGAGFGFTGEQTDDNDLIYLRARYYNPDRGIFPSLDPFEGTMQRPMSLNGYSWVEGNPIMNIDPSGEFVGALVACAFNAACVATAAATATAVVGVGVGIYWTFLGPCSLPRILNGTSSCASIAKALSDVCAPVLKKLHPLEEEQTNDPFWRWGQEPGPADDKERFFAPSRPPEHERTQERANTWHIAFGLARIGGFTSPGVYGAPALEAFVDKLNIKFPGLRRYPTVKFDRLWYRENQFPHGEPPLSTTSNFPVSFYEAINDPRVVHIHFNMEGIEQTIAEGGEVSSIRDFVVYNGNSGREYMGFRQTYEVDGKEYSFIVTAWELGNIINDKQLCLSDKVSFYSAGTQDVSRPNQRLKSEICNINLN